MPLVHVFDTQRNRLNCRARGPITWGDIQHHLEAERADQYLGHAELIDATEATVAFSGDEVRHIVESVRQLGTAHRLGPTAIVVSGDLAYGVVRMLEVLLEGICPVRPFRTTAQAEEWLAAVSVPVSKEQLSAP